LKKSSFAGSARGWSTQRQSNRGRGRADSVAGRSSLVKFWMTSLQSWGIVATYCYLLFLHQTT
jgi:hypothetical protein